MNNEKFIENLSKTLKSVHLDDGSLGRVMMAGLSEDELRQLAQIVYADLKNSKYRRWVMDVLFPKYWPRQCQ
jgi:hypothetical protein